MGNNIIEINGKRYDARSGTFLGEGVKSAIQHQHASHRGRVIDGFVKTKPQAVNVGKKSLAYNEKVAPAKVAAAAVHKPKMQVKATGMSMELVARRPDISRSPAKVVPAHKPEKAKTLMRHAVKKPDVNMKKAIKTQAPSEIAAAAVKDLAPQHKVAAHNVDSRRKARALQAPQSRRIQRFTPIQQNFPVQRAQAVAVASSATRRPTTTPVQHAAPGKSATSPAHNTAHNQQPQHKTHHTPRHADIFEAAIANAKSHEQPAHKPKRKTSQRLAGIAAGLAAFVVLGGFVAYMNMPNIEMRVASVKAGFSAQLPSYAPTGYAMEGGIKAQRGVVAATYRSGTSAYTIQQQSSDWDSQTLYDNVVAMSTEKQETLSGQGRTVYVYGDNAAWVNGGVLYSVKTDGSLSNQEILSIATSM